MRRRASSTGSPGNSEGETRVRHAGKQAHARAVVFQRPGSPFIGRGGNRDALEVICDGSHVTDTLFRASGESRGFPYASARLDAIDAGLIARRTIDLAFYSLTALPFSTR